LTLDEMYHEIASYVDEEIAAAGPYTGDELILVNKFKSAINYAYINKIAKEKYRLEYKDTVTLDNDQQFALSALTKTFYEIRKIEDINESKITNWEFSPDEKVYFPYNASGETFTVYYYCLPDELTGTGDTPIFPAAAVDHKILCFFAAFQYWNIEDDEDSISKANKWLALWNDGYNNIKQNRGQKRKIRRVGWC